MSIFLRIKALFDGKDVDTGLQRLTGGAQKFAGDLEKKLSFAGLGRSVLSGFGLASGFAIAEKAASMIVRYWERAAAAAEAIAAASDRTTRAVLARIRINETPEQEVRRLERENVGLRATPGGSLGENIAGSFGGLIGGAGRFFGLIRSPEEQARARAEALATADENDLRVAQLKKEIAEKEAAALRDYESLRGRLADAQERTDLAEMSDLEQANFLRAKIARLRQSNGTTEQGIRDQIEAEQLMPQERAARKRALESMVEATLQDIYGGQPEGSSITSPAIVASSLARVGGGGNVAVFGGGDVALNEARRQTQLLERIARGVEIQQFGPITRAPASDIGG